jgi:hypothetical protein
MSTDPVRRFRPGYRHAALAALATLAILAAGCLISVWCVANAHGTPDIRQAIGQTERDTQLPLERFAVEAGEAAAPRVSSESPPQSGLVTGEPLAASCRVPVPRKADIPQDVATTRRAARHVQPAPYPTWRNWKNWT